MQHDTLKHFCLIFTHYLINLLDMTAPKGVTIQMPCRAKGSPQPTITWLKDGHAMVSPR